jgi:hypothetical protein
MKLPPYPVGMPSQLQKTALPEQAQSVFTFDPPSEGPFLEVPCCHHASR